VEKVDLYKYEKELYKKGIKYIGGVDEVGRGPLIGPVVTACVVLPKDFVLEGLDDSKKLSEKKRDIYYSYIIENALAYAVGECSPEEIDKHNIYQATKIAMKRAIDKVNEKIILEHILIDAMPLELDIPTTSIIKGDSKSISIAAASVIAKVVRDKMMYELDEKYPEYGFKNHKGYPTKKHIEAINKYGLIEGYRKSYGPVKGVRLC
jgi:Ribonuclease HII